LRFAESRINAVVDGHGRCGVASAQARGAADGHVAGAKILQAVFQIRAQSVRAAQMAGHVLADADVGLRRRGQAKMRIKTGYAVQAVERNVDFRSEIPEFFGR